MLIDANRSTKACLIGTLRMSRVEDALTDVHGREPCCLRFQVRSWPRGQTPVCRGCAGKSGGSAGGRAIVPDRGRGTANNGGATTVLLSVWEFVHVRVALLVRNMAGVVSQLDCRVKPYSRSVKQAAGAALADTLARGARHASAAGGATSFTWRPNA